MLVNETSYLEDFFRFHIMSKFLHDFLIEKQVASVVEFLYVAQDYIKVNK